MSFTTIKIQEILLSEDWFHWCTQPQYYSESFLSLMHTTSILQWILPLIDAHNLNITVNPSSHWCTQPQYYSASFVILSMTLLPIHLFTHPATLNILTYSVWLIHSDTCSLTYFLSFTHSLPPHPWFILHDNSLTQLTDTQAHYWKNK